MDPSLLAVLTTGFVLGWSVSWPPGPINAEIARRCLAGGFWAGFTLLLGACSGDALWALLAAFGVALVFTGATMRALMGGVSVALLLVLAALFLHSAWRALRVGAAMPAAPSRFDSRRASYWLGASMALLSPWNIAFWLAAIGRPGIADQGPARLLAMVGAVIAGGLTWGLLWSLSVVLLRGRAKAGPGARWWTVGVNAATGLLMIVFAINALRALATSH